MLAIALFGVAFATCGLPASIDPDGDCVTDDNGFSVLDADTSESIPLSLSIHTKGETVDAFKATHGATQGDLSDDTDADGRYVLACKQVEGYKTVKMTVYRPAALTAFGGEWVQLFPKDSWENTTNEYEPFTFNMYGAKIPLPGFRSTPTGLGSEPADTNNEAIDGTGLSSQSSNGAQTEESGNVGTSAPEATTDYVNVYMEVSDDGDYEVMYGNPNLVSSGKWVAVQFRSTLLRVGTPWGTCSDAVQAEEVYPVGSIMPILFGGPNLNSIALLAGNPSYLDVISELSGVTVPVKVVLEIFNSKKKSYTDSKDDKQCYKAGNACPEAHLVCQPDYCEMDVWKMLIATFKAASPGKVTVLGAVDVDGTTASEYDTLSTAAVGHTKAGSTGAPVDGYYFTCPELDSTTYKSGSDCVIEAGLPEGTTTVLGLGSPLFDTSFLERANVVGGDDRDNTKVDAASVYVTLSSHETGIWNPFSWYPYVPATKWAAMVTDRLTVDDVSVLFDRGYGWVYLTSETGYQTKSTIMAPLLDAIENTATGRRQLQSRHLAASAPFWGCDDTLFECKPICLKKMGVTTMKVADSLCSAAPMDQCACKCFHEAQWTCEGSSVVCKAKYGAGELKTVGDKVCETRGAKKPASTAELRVASACEPVTEMRGSAPTAQCLAQWGTTPAPVVEEKASTPAPDSPPKVTVPVIEESFASTLALAALALYA